MDSEMSFLLQHSETRESLCVPNEGNRDQNEGENYGENSGYSGNGKKRRLTLDQVQLLERSFNVGNKLEHETKLRLAKEMGLQPRQVAVWFQNRRARSKTKKMENDYDSLNLEYEKLKNHYGNLVEENRKLKAEVDELRGKWVATEKMKNGFEAVEAMDSSFTEFGKSNTSTMGEDFSNVKMRSFRPEEGSRSSSKSDVFYSESSAMENQSDFFQDEEEEEGYLGNLGKLEDGGSVLELMDSYNFISAVEDQPFFFWP